MTTSELTTLVTRYLDTLAAEGVPDPLGERLTVAVVLADLLGLAGARVPRAIEARLHEPVADPATGLAAD